MNLPILHLILGFWWLAASVIAQSRPPNFSPDAIPDTSFSCEDKITGGYYADLEAECQLFHVCVQVSEFQFQDFRFLCPNDTVFDQQNLVCTNWFDVDCKAAVHFFIQEIGIKDSARLGPKNRNKSILPPREDEYSDEDFDYRADFNDAQSDNSSNRFLANESPALTTGNRGVGGSQSGQGFPKEANDADYDFGGLGSLNSRPPKPSKSTTAIAIGVTTTTTRRPPRVKSDIRLNGVNQGRNRARPRLLPTGPTIDFNSVSGDDDQSKDLLNNPPLVSADGKRPRVKSNIKANWVSGKSGHSRNSLRAGVKVNQVDTSNIEFVTPKEQDESFISPSFSGAEVRPDGRPARVKANEQAAKQSVGKHNIHQIPVDNSNSFEVANFETVEPQPTTQGSRVQTDDLFLSTVIPDFPDADVASVEQGSINEPPLVFFEQNEAPQTFSSPSPVLFVTTNVPTQQPSQPRVKSNILANQRNFGRGQTQAKSKAPVQSSPSVDSSVEDPRSSRFNTFDKPATPKPDHVSSVPPPPVNQPLFIDEIDEIEGDVQSPADEDQAFIPTTSPPLSFTSPTPRVKSNILASGQNTRFNQHKRPVIARPDNAVTVRNNEEDFTQTTVPSVTEADDEGCNNPFKCPPSTVADGRRPRVKSNIKAFRRNFHFPDAQNAISTRIRGRVKSPVREQFENNLTTRQDKALLKDEHKSINNVGKPTRNQIFRAQSNIALTGDKSLEVKDSTAVESTTVSLDNTDLNFVTQPQFEEFVGSSTENLLYVLLNQIGNGQKEIEAGLNEEPITPSSRPTFSSTTESSSISPTPLRTTVGFNLPPPPQPSFSQVSLGRKNQATANVTSPRLKSNEQTRQEILNNTYERLQTFLLMKQKERDAAKRSKNLNATRTTPDSFVTATSSSVLPDDASAPPTRFPPQSRPAPVSPTPIPSLSPEEIISATTTPEAEPPVTTEVFVSSSSPPRSTVTFSVDGKAPRVKSNIRLAAANSNTRKKFPVNSTPDRSRFFFTTTTTTTTTTTPSTTSSTEQNEITVTLSNDLSSNGAALFAAHDTSFSSQPRPPLGALELALLADEELDLPDVTTEALLPTKVSASSDQFDSASFRPDGRKPRVKSNIRAQLASLGRGPVKRRVPVKVTDSINFVDESQNKNPERLKINEDDDQPVVRPDGLKPRVKSNLQPLGGHLSKPENRGFRHSTKPAVTQRPKFEETSSYKWTETISEQETTLTDFEPTPSSEQKENAASTSPPPSTTSTESPVTSSSSTVNSNEAAVSTTPSYSDTSIRDFFFSTQVLNTRAVDPTLASLQASPLFGSGNTTTTSRPLKGAHSTSTEASIIV